MAIASAAEGYFAWLMPVVLCMFMYIIPFFFFSFVVCVEAQVLCIYCCSICCVRTGIDVAGRVGPRLYPLAQDQRIYREVGVSYLGWFSSQPLEL